MDFVILLWAIVATYGWHRERGLRNEFQDLNMRLINQQQGTAAETMRPPEPVPDYMYEYVTPDETTKKPH